MQVSSYRNVGISNWFTEMRIPANPKGVILTNGQSRHAYFGSEPGPVFTNMGLHLISGRTINHMSINLRDQLIDQFSNFNEFYEGYVISSHDLGLT